MKLFKDENAPAPAPHTIGAKVLQGQRNRFKALKNIRRTEVPGKGYRSYKGGGD